MNLYVRKLSGTVRTRFPVVFLHGFMGSGADWEKDIFASFSGYAIDLPGHGKSVNLPAHLYDFTNVAELLRSSIAETRARKVSLVGYSMGGRIALEFARQFPGKVQHLILESTSPGLAEIDERRRRAEEDAARAALLRLDPDLFFRQWLELELFQSLRNRPSITKLLTYERQAANAEEWARAIEGLSPSNQSDFRPWLLKTKKRITFITGELDAVYTAVAHDMSQKNSQIRHITVHDAGHNVHLEQPEMYLQMVQDILVE